MQKSFANHWVMLYEKNGNLVILPKWDPRMVRRTRHFCGRAHASRYVERWIGSLALAPTPEAVAAPVLPPVLPMAGQPQLVGQGILDAEDEATALELAARYG
jgi:hypothetical protein